MPVEKKKCLIKLLTNVKYTKCRNNYYRTLIILADSVSVHDMNTKRYLDN